MVIDTYLLNFKHFKDHDFPKNKMKAIQRIQISKEL